MKFRISALKLQVSLRSRFALGLGAVLLPFLLAAVVGQLYLLPRLIGPLDDIVRELTEELEPVTHLQIVLLQAAMPVNDYLINGDADERRQFAELRQRVERAFEEVSPERFTQAEERALVRVARAQWVQALPLGEQLLRLPDPVGNTAAARDMKRFDAHIDRAVSALDEAHSYFERVIDENRAQVGAARTKAMWITFVAFALAAVVSLFANAVLVRPLLAGLGTLGKATTLLTRGDLSARALLDRKDELGQLALAFNTMADELEKRALQLSTLNQIAVAIASSLNSHDNLNDIMRSGIALTGAKASCIAFYDEATALFTQWVTQGLSEHFVGNISFRPGGLADEAFTSGSHVLSNDRPETGHKLSRLTREEHLRCFICLPLTSHNHRLGVIYFYRSDRDTFTPTEVELLTTFASLAAQAIENARLYTQVQKQARTDALTGLNNRGEFQRQLKEEEERARRYHRSLSLLMLDVDHFKHVNDTHGHQAGDEVLRALAARLREQIRPVDHAARYGGEEFVVILPETSNEGALDLAERLRMAVAGTVVPVAEGRTIPITISIGVATFPADAGSEAALIAAADAALYAAKQGGKNRVVRYEPAPAPVAGWR